MHGKVESETVYEKGNYSDIFFFSRSLSLCISVGFHCSIKHVYYGVLLLLLLLLLMLLLLLSIFNEFVSPFWYSYLEISSLNRFSFVDRIKNFVICHCFSIETSLSGWMRINWTRSLVLILISRGSTQSKIWNFALFILLFLVIIADYHHMCNQFMASKV